MKARAFFSFAEHILCVLVSSLAYFLICSYVPGLMLHFAVTFLFMPFVCLYVPHATQNNSTWSFFVSCVYYF